MVSTFTNLNIFIIKDIMKICTVCKEEKDYSHFSKNKKRKDGYQSECKICSNIRSRKRYGENKEVMIKQINEARDKRINEHRELFYQILCDSKCIDCGNDDPLVLEFDHINGDTKKHGLSKMVHDGYSWDNILKEIEKCEVRCANCHRIKTAKEQGWFKYIVK